jgi:uncharacterized protein
VSNVILTIGGEYFDYHHPENYRFTVSGIAHALGNLCRFTGNTRVFYSVAEHSVLVSRLVPQHLALTALFHDATEAVLGDVASPLKALLPEYKALEDRTWRVIAKQLLLPEVMPPEIKYADTQALLLEKEQLLPIPADQSPWVRAYDQVGLPRHDEDINVRGLLPDLATRLFLQRYSEVV